MARRMIVVPEEVYEGLISSRKNVLANPIDNKLQEASDNVSTILHNPGKKPLEKFTEYDQEVKNVRKFMNMRNDHHNEPNLQDVFAGFVQQLQQMIIPQAPTPAVIAPTPALPDPPTQMPAVPRVPLIDNSPNVPSRGVKPEIVAKGRSTSAPAVKKSQLEPQPMDQEPVQVPDAQMRDDTAFITIRDRVLANPTRYAVTPDGKVLRSGGRAFYNSCLEDSLAHILESRSDPPPPATDTLRENLLDDPEIGQMLPRRKVDRLTAKAGIRKYGYVDRTPKGRSQAKGTSKIFRAALWDIKKEPTSPEIDPEQEGERPTARDMVNRQLKKEKEKKASVGVRRRLERSRWKKSTMFLTIHIIP